MLLRQEAIKESETIYEVITPQNYNSLKKYPLLIVLHGGGSTIEKEKKYWHSKRLRNEFILVFIQSYLYLDMTSYSWGISDERARTDLKKCYNEIKEQYYVDTNKIIIAGISSGGYTAMDISINNIFPTNGFFVICPDVMANDFNIESIRRAKLSGIKGVIISGENDYTLKNKKQ